MLHLSPDMLSTCAFAALCPVAAGLITRAMTLSRTRGMTQPIACALPIAIAAGGVWSIAGAGAAIALLFACAVGAAMFCGGVVMLVAGRRMEQAPIMQSPSASLLLPVALVLFVAGSNGPLTQASCMGLVLLALLAADVFRGEEQHGGQRIRSIALGTLIAVAPASVLAFAVRQTLQRAGMAAPGVSPDVASIALIAPAALAPCLVRSLRNASNDPAGAVRLTSMVTIITIAVFLPGLVVLDYGVRGAGTEVFAPIPPLSWRLDGALLAVAGFALVAMRLDLLRPERWVAILHIVLYLAYVLASVALRIA